MAGFWSFRQGNRVVEGTAVVEMVEELEPIELYTPAALMTGAVAPNGQRMSDLLNDSATIRVRGLVQTPFVNDLAVQDGAEEWQSVRVDDVLLVMPPEHVSPRQKRIHRRQHRVRMTVGDFEVTGNLHGPPGASIEQYVARAGVKFLPVTQATAYSNTETAWERVAPVLLVNASYIREAHDVLRIV